MDRAQQIKAARSALADLANHAPDEPAYLALATEAQARATLATLAGPEPADGSAIISPCLPIPPVRANRITGLLLLAVERYSPYAGHAPHAEQAQQALDDWRRIVRLHGGEAS